MFLDSIGTVKSGGSGGEGDTLLHPRIRSRGEADLFPEEEATSTSESGVPIRNSLSSKFSSPPFRSIRSLGRDCLFLFISLPAAMT